MLRGTYVPPLERIDRGYQGIEVVADKEINSVMIVSDAGADTLIMMADIDAVYIDYKTRSVRPFTIADSSKQKKLLDQGQLPSGSMSLKAMSAFQCANAGGKKDAIANAANLSMGLQGQRGTTVVRER